MGYLDRLRVGRYTSPSGRGFAFSFDDLSREAAKKSAVHEIPESDSAVVQDLGGEADRFKLALYFVGPDYDEVADAFYAALKEPGPGLLVHPRWGDLPVLAVSVSQTERFVDGMGRADFDIDFVHAPPPGSAASTKTASAVASAARSARSLSEAAMAPGFGIPVLADLAEAKKQIRKTLRSVKRTMLKVTGTVKELSQRISAELLAIDSDLDTLVESPAELAAALGSVISAAASAPGPIVDKLAAFVELLSDGSTPTTAAQAALAITTAQVVASSAVEAATEGELLSRADAIAAHDSLVSLYAAARAAIERAEGYGTSADHEAMQALAYAAAQGAAYLLEESFSLRVERRATLEGAATPLELVWRFYSSLDRLDEFERQNHLGGDSLLVIPAGTEVSYYAE